LLEHTLRRDAAEATRETDQPFLARGDVRERDARRSRSRWSLPPLRDQADEILVALVTGREHDQVIDGAASVRARHVELAAEDRLQAGRLALLPVAHRAEHVGVIGQRDRAHPELFGARHQRLELHHAHEERELGVNVEVDELRCHRRATFPRLYHRTLSGRERARLHRPHPRTSEKAPRPGEAPCIEHLSG
jgi:hypothetical protein